MPQDIEAERTVLATMLTDPTSRPSLAAVVSAADYWRPAHGDLSAVMTDLADYDPPAVLAEMRRRRHDVTLVPTLIGAATTTAMAVVHARQVADCARRRTLIAASMAAIQRASSPESPMGDVILGLMSVVEGLSAEHERVAAPVTVEDFLAGEDVYDWIVPGLIERDDRVMITGGEGAGKSLALAQIAICAAAGLHPFTGARVEPMRVVIVDLENSRPILRRRLRPLLAVAQRYRRPVEPGRLRIIHRPEGIDLGRIEDHGWLADRVCAASPDLVVIGPLYRLHTASLDKEEAARAITVALDAIRHRARCALVVEAHSPHGMSGQRWWRPAGSSLFMRWAPFGLGLKPLDDGSVELGHWRGPRDERHWPSKLARGGEGNWPWIEDEPDSTWRDLA